MSKETSLTKNIPKNGSTLPAFKYLDLVAVVFTLVLVLSNIASGAKIIDWKISLAGLPLAFDAGTLFFPVAYIFGDILTEVYGFKSARRVIWLGFLSLVFAFLMFLLIQKLPGEATWQQSVGQEAYDKVLGGFSMGGLALASISGYLGGSFSNAIIIAAMKHFSKGRWLWLRAIVSTIVGELVDTFLFVAVASLLGVFPWSLFWSLSITNYIFKVVIEALMLPLTYLITKSLKKAEDIEVYSDLSDLNPLKF